MTAVLPTSHTSPLSSSQQPGFATRLLELAGRLRSLSPNWQDPEKFHLQKSELFDGLRRLADDLAATGATLPGRTLPSTTQPLLTVPTEPVPPTRPDQPVLATSQTWFAELLATALTNQPEEARSSPSDGVRELVAAMHSLEQQITRLGEAFTGAGQRFPPATATLSATVAAVPAPVSAPGNGAAVSAEPAVLAVADSTTRASRYPPGELMSDAGRARVCEMWLAGQTQREIGKAFGLWYSGEASVSAAIATFVCEQLGLARIPASASGPRRKPLVSEALAVFRRTGRAGRHY